MKIEHKSNFISIFENVYPDNFCAHLISDFEKLKNYGAGSNRQDGEGADKHTKDDYFIFANAHTLGLTDFEEKNPYRIFWDGLQACFKAYADQYSILKDVKLRANSMKIQKTSEGGGYHVWHAEQGNGESSSRGLVYMLYLNTLPDKSCGETEFLYQGERIKTQENTMVIWPSAFTHVHRGNAVYGKTAKYIITGWFYYE